MADNDIFMSSRWFSPYISSAEMEAKMKGEEYAGKDGVFGVRVSKSNPSLVETYFECLELESLNLTPR